MIYIESQIADGQAVYIDIHSVERGADGLRVCGTIGDGCYEGEVLVESGRISDVTFADAWLGGDGFHEFLSRCDIDRLRQSLLETITALPFFTVQHNGSDNHKSFFRKFQVTRDVPLLQGVA